MTDRRRPDAETAIAREAQPCEPAAAVAQTLRELGLQFGERAGMDEVPPGGAPFAETGFGAGVGDAAERALLASLGIDAVIDTNSTVSQRSLHEFLR